MIGKILFFYTGILKKTGIRVQIFSNPRIFE